MKAKLIGIVAGVLAFGAAGAASAADMAVKARPAPPPPVAVYNWTGCYIGLNGGWGSAHKENIDLFNPAAPASLGSHTADGGVFGGQVGCDYQAGRFVIGARGMWDGASIDGSNVIPQNPAVAYNTHIDSFATATVRAGFLAVPSFLLYVQGGGIWLRDRHQQFVNGVLFGNNQETQTRSGWTAGVGGEWMFAPNWSVFAEYNYAWFDDNRTCFVVGGCTTTSFGINQKLNFQTVLVGVNWRFNFGGPAVVAKY